MVCESYANKGTFLKLGHILMLEAAELKIHAPQTHCDIHLPLECGPGPETKSQPGPLPGTQDMTDQKALLSILGDPTGEANSCGGKGVCRLPPKAQGTAEMTPNDRIDFMAALSPISPFNCILFKWAGLENQVSGTGGCF